MWLLLYYLFLVADVSSDMYLHNPRGSNNRLNEDTANRMNANRLFDSQNNNRGGYNVGDKRNTAAKDEQGQYNMLYFQSSKWGKSHLQIEWTNQHGCGVGEVNCNIVLQYMCQPDTDSVDVNIRIRDGISRAIQNFATGKTFTDRTKGLHESIEYYDDCQQRDRNKNLFTSTQNLNGNTAKFTRQNANGARRGFECPEERDYYPYWHPNPWKDIAVLTSDTAQCAQFRAKSFNTATYFRCFKDGKFLPKYGTKEDCEQNGRTWLGVKNYLEKSNKEPVQCRLSKSHMWAVPYDTKDGSPECLAKLPQPNCKMAPSSRTNHLGNGKSDEHNSYLWRLPYFPSGDTQRCVLRARYNISTDDNPATLKGNPQVQAGGVKLQLAINTAQFGRTFQDRSHVFKLVPRTKEMGNSRLFNLNVRGKRGNIVQTFPAVEYDFVPKQLNIIANDLVHIQWTGSNTHNNNNAGNAGQGAAGTDRNNVVEIEKLNVNYPSGNTKLWNLPVVWSEDKTLIGTNKATQLITAFASAGYSNANTAMDINMNNAPASFSGAVLNMTMKNQYHYMCSRNNAFTNRRQKGTIKVI